MQSIFSDFFQKKKIDLFSALPLSLCEIRKPYLLEREEISDGTVIMIAVPYFTRAARSPDRNLSAYAVCRDYHGFFRVLFDELIPLLRARYPNERFAGFADHSPIAELQAAARAGLGVIGRNGLLITERYSSYVFLGEVITTAVLPSAPVPIRECVGCGKCRRACPMEDLGGCLSALTQKKGAPPDGLRRAIRQYRTVWGCDICQEVCPYTQRAMESGSIFSPIPFFSEETVPCLTTELLDSMSDEEFAARSFAWRGRETVRRNLLLYEEQKPE